jgi:membrane protease YdiL (CAAX protease family)
MAHATVEPSLSGEQVNEIRPTEGGLALSRLKRFQHLGLVLWVSFSIPILGSSYYLLGGTSPPAAVQNYRLWAAILAEASSLLVLRYVMNRQGKSWNDIGCCPGFADFPRAIGILIVVNVATLMLWIPVQSLYRAYSGQYLAPKSLNSILGFGVSAASVVFICLNPFFEELIVRAYTMSEIVSLGGSRNLAVVISILLQMSYHLYQGLANALVLAVTFTVFSIYYARTHKIVPVILVHLFLDVFALVRGFH